MTSRTSGPSNSTEISNADLWTMLLSTIRYSMGRMTYMPSLCRGMLKRYGRNLKYEQLRQIQKEIMEELRQAIAANRTLGDKCDDDEWRAAVQDIEKLLENKPQT